MYHKETKDNEVFVGNVKAEKDLSYLKGVSYRKGKQAYCVHGTKLDPLYMLPLFVTKNTVDIYNKIMMDT